MKKLIYLIPIALFAACGGVNQQDEVCRCKKVYDEKRAYEEKLEADGVVTGDAIKQAKEKYGEDVEKCEKFHAEVGDEKFYEMSKECK